MICEECHQNLATVHLTELVHGPTQKQKKERHLCEECYRGKADLKASFSFAEALGIAEGKKKGTEKAEKKGKEKEKGKEEAPAPKAEPQPPCPTCGITFADFRTSGRLGCPNDYEHFKRSLLPLLEKIHGATQHTGKTPAHFGEKVEQQKLLTVLRKDLNLAIQREEYERAAELRDRIKNLEQQGPVQQEQRTP